MFTVFAQVGSGASISDQWGPVLQSSSSQSGDTTLTMTTTELSLASAEETAGTAKFIYNGDGMNLNLTPAVAAIIVGILCKFTKQSTASFSKVLTLSSYWLCE